MSNSNEIKNIFQKYNIFPSKKWGQNFLIDQNILQKIVRVANIKNKDVIEIGAGLGFLTNLLLIEAKSLISYEVDINMVNILKQEIKAPNFHLEYGDFLKQDFNWKTKKTIVANIPYYITSDIIFKIFNNVQKFDRVILMVQKAVAEKLVAPIGSKTYGKLTITANYFTNSQIKKEFIVKSNAFFPTPKVDSAIVSFTLSHEEKDWDFVLFIKQCFAMRRKTLFNNLKLILGKSKAQNAIEKTKLKNNIRPQELSLKQFIDLYKNN